MNSAARVNSTTTSAKPSPTASTRPKDMISCTSLLRLMLFTFGGYAAVRAAPTPSVEPFNEPMALTFADEFNGDRLDPAVWVSQAYEKGLSRETARGPNNLKVCDGELRLYVRKEPRRVGDKMSTWTAGYVHTRAPLETNVLIEARLRGGGASGVNNAFWLANPQGKGNGVSDRYEIDIVETRLDVTAPTRVGRGHLAWHDWKTFAYAKNRKGQSDHIAQGMLVEHSWDEYHIWALWLGEHDTIYYLDGKEVWRGTTHPQYTDQYRTGVGKLPRWFPQLEREAYGKFGQNDWSYFGGYTGDRMNIVFSNLPWGDPWTPLTDAADGTYMAIDYVRVFRPQRLLVRDPMINEIMGPALAIRADSPAHEVQLPATVPLAADDRWPVYFSFVATVGERSRLTAEFLAANDTASFALEGAGRELRLTAGDARVSTASAFPATERVTPWVETNRPMLWLARVTPANGATGKPAVSWCMFPVDAVPEREPYFYANVDPAGNTSRNNGWHLNAKSALAGTVRSVRFRSSGGSATVHSLKSGPSYLSVLPHRNLTPAAEPGAR
jgi:beta-glucanase (GH16 family)